jgi:hypothetical protein
MVGCLPRSGLFQLGLFCWRVLGTFLSPQSFLGWQSQLVLFLYDFKFHSKKSSSDSLLWKTKYSENRVIFRCSNWFLNGKYVPSLSNGIKICPPAGKKGAWLIVVKSVQHICV